MRFSMIIPCHNSAYRMTKLLLSLTDQSFKDFEIIFVCDKCTDDTAYVLNAIFENDIQSGKIKIIECEHGNAGLARNEGLNVAQGEYILFADDDDFILHRFVFEEIDRMITAHNNPDIIHFGFIFGGNGYVYPTWNNGHLYGNVWSKCYKKTAIGETRFPNVYPDDDLQFNKLMEQKDIRHVLCDSPIYYYNYMREGSITWKEKMQKS